MPSSRMSELLAVGQASAFLSFIPFVLVFNLQEKSEWTTEEGEGIDVCPCSPTLVQTHPAQARADTAHIPPPAVYLGRCNNNGQL